jgi:serine protease Do
LVSLAEPGSPADSAGLTRGDVILKIDDADVRDGRDMARKVAAAAPGTAIAVTIFRGGERRTVKVTLRELEDEPQPASPKPVEKPQAAIAALGLSVTVCDSLQEGETGLSVLEIKPDGLAADSGLVQGDILLTANGMALRAASDVERALLDAKRAGKKYALAFIRRGGNELFVALSTEGM